jgi:hypothetical protein
MKKRLSPTVIYILVAVGISAIGLLLTGHLLPQWASGQFVGRLSLVVIHLMVLGFMLTIANGVLYQVVPIAFQAPPIPRQTINWHLPVHLASLLAMLMGFAWGRWRWVAIGGIGVFVASAVFIGLVFTSYRQARNKTVVHRLLTLPITSLFLVMAIGIDQAADPSSINIHLLVTHASVGGMAFWVGLVMVISYKFIPMFSLSHGYKVSAPLTVGSYFSGIYLIIIAELLRMWVPAWVHWEQYMRQGGSLLALMALLGFAFDLIRILHARKRKRIVRPVVSALTATSVLMLSQAALLVSLFEGRPIWLLPSAYLFIFGGLVPLIFSYVQKIVPFLWFEYRFSRRPERKTAPLIDDMVPSLRATGAFITYYVGVAIGFATLTVPNLNPETSQLSGWLSGIITALATVILYTALRHVLNIGGPRPSDDDIE